MKVTVANINVAFDPAKTAKANITGTAKVYIALEDHLKIPLFSKGISLYYGSK